VGNGSRQRDRIGGRERRAFKLRASLIDVIDQLDAVDDTDRFEPPCIFAVGGPDALPTAPAIVCPSDEEGSFVCPQDPDLSYVLQVQQAKECIEVWSAWRGGRRPTSRDKFAAVMYYSRNDAWLPVE
jgi:hypothetical protein